MRSALLFIVAFGLFVILTVVVSVFRLDRVEGE